MIATSTLLLAWLALPLEPLRVPVSLQDEAGAAPAIVAQAKEVAAGIFAGSGIELRWTDAAVRVVILKTRFRDVPKHALGLATLLPGREGSYAAISLPAVEDAARSEDVAPGIVLGASLAHEIGHVLLGTGHSAAGVMTPRFTREQLGMAACGRLHFLKEEAQRLRSRTNALLTGIRPTGRLRLDTVLP